MEFLILFGFLVMLHLIGDYLFQTEFIASTKGENWYHLIVHSILYAVPFLFVVPDVKAILALILTHIVIDASKARYHLINYWEDQMLHYIVLLVMAYLMSI